MDYFIRIQHAISFIEKNLQEEMNIAEIASEACFSAFHFQRIFQAISGFTVHEYIRKRRLSEAALVLKHSDMNVIDAAIAFQYNSQEAFTRAFESNFGITPGKFRKSDQSVDYQTAINFMDFQKSNTSEFNIHKPIFTSLQEISIIGFEYRTNLNHEKHFEDIPGFYHDFGQNGYYMRIPNQVAPNMAYGVSTHFQDSGEFSFIVGEEVAKCENELDKGFVRIQIPAGKYAEFNASGPHGRVKEYRDYIYGTWLPNSKYERTDGPDFEITDVMNSAFPHDLKIKVYIPIV